MLAGSPVLVELVLGTDHAGVRRADDGSHWLAVWSDADPDRVHGAELGGAEPGAIALGDDVLVAGGLLPDGAAAVEVQGADGAWLAAQVAAGAWVAALPGADAVPPVRSTPAP